MYIMAGLLILGFLCNSMVKPVDDKYLMAPEEETQATDTAIAPAAVRTKTS